MSLSCLAANHWGKQSNGGGLRDEGRDEGFTGAGRRGGGGGVL